MAKKLVYDRAINIELSSNSKVSVPDGEVWKVFVHGAFRTGSPEEYSTGIIAYINKSELLSSVTRTTSSGYLSILSTAEHLILGGSALVDARKNISIVGVAFKEVEV